MNDMKDTTALPDHEFIRKESIREVVTRFAWSFDRSDWTAMRTLLAEHVQVDYSGVSGAEPELVPAPEQIARWQEFVGPLHSWQHMTSMPVIELAADRATAHVNVVAWLRRDDATGPSVASSGGTWTFDLTRDADDAWRISSMTAKASWFDGNQTVVG